MARGEKPDARDDGQKVASPSVSLPKGGGAIRGIGEKFAANPVTGTGSMSVPIASSPGRSDFGPQLTLSYDSGAGNGPFGFGWSLGLPQITRKTDKGLPRYDDAGDSDVFILSGAEDLVPLLVEQNGAWVPETLPDRVIGADTYAIRRYRPRIEGLFARIERWTRRDGDVHWRSISKDNILTLYGKDAKSRIKDPEDPRRVFSWLICETRDDKGNAVLYDYKPEDGAGVVLTHAHERNRGDRDDVRRQANRYLKAIRYGNRVPLLDGAGRRPRALTPAQVDNAGWMFEIVFDYGEHAADAPKPGGTGAWTHRSDPFSTFRSGFEVRTARLCRRVLMFHHFDGEPGVGRDCLVRSTDFGYSHEQNPLDVRNPIYSFLLSVTQCGYKRDGAGYLKRSLPPVEYQYTQPIVQDAVHTVDDTSLENLPIGVDGSSYQWTDLHGEGIPGILSEHAGAWFYKRNISPISAAPVEFAPLERVAARANLSLVGGQAQFMDLAGDGQPDLVVLDGPMPGLYEHDGKEGWNAFRPFTSRLNREMRDPNLKFVDLDGDGHADVLISEDDAFVWHPSLAEEGFGPGSRVYQSLDEENGPRLVFADGTESIFLADLNGDGLADLVRIRNGDVCYWPNFGYGRFGAKVTMDHAPLFDNPDQFDHDRLRLADIDGSGTTDLIYLHRDGVHLYFNQSGNSWGAPQLLRVFPRLDDVVSIVPTDLLGNGTACLVWSSPLQGDARRQMRFVDLMGGQKPHLLVKAVNNLGAETRVQYAPSTKFYLQDKRAGTPWITRLPFPVHVVERVETYDHVSRNRFLSRYAYHHGYFDGEEREFRGFGMVEQWDTEELAALTGDGMLPAANIDPASHVPPVRSRTWFHTGVYLGREHVSDAFAGVVDAQDKGEYYREPGLTDDEARTLLLPDSALPSGLTLQEEREACRALKGSMLRQEVYADDGTSKAAHPYIVTEQNFTIRRLQPRNGTCHAVFFTHAREAINFHYERNPADPRVQHAMTLEADRYGNVLKEAAIGYGRRQTIRVVDDQGIVQMKPNAALNELDPDHRKKQTDRRVTYTENRVTEPIDAPAVEPDDYRPPLPCETRTFELTGYPPTGVGARYATADFVRVAGNGLAHVATTDIDYEDLTTVGKERRLIEHVRTLYRRNDLTGLLPLGTVQTRALPGESYKLAFTPGLAQQIYVDSGKLTGVALDAVLANEGRYVHSEGDASWWIPSGRIFLSPGSAHTPAEELTHARQHFFVPNRYRDPFHTNAVSTETFVTYDDYDLLIAETRDPVGNVITAATEDDVGNTRRRLDYRVLQPYWVTDPNGNRTRVAFDALGMVVGTALMGKAGENRGDSLDGFAVDLDEAVVLDRLANPLTDPTQLLGPASTRLVYDFFAYQRTKNQPAPEPAVVYGLARETHHADLGPGQQTRVQHNFSYSDGFGREIQRRNQAEPGPLADGGQVISPRWAVSGWTIFNNKGRPVREYEPFFSATHRFAFGVETGVSPVVFYDPLQRVIAILRPNHTYEKVVFDAWRQATWDVNDTVLGDPRTDADTRGQTAGYFAGVPASPPAPAWMTWHAGRQGGALGAHEQAAAVKAAAHADTPTTAHFDTLGRPFATVADNGPDPLQPGRHLLFATRVELDVEGNHRAVRDAVEQAGDRRGRVIMRYAYDMLGQRIHQLSMEAGVRWTLGDVAGRPMWAWDSRGHTFRTEYDSLRRPLRSFVAGADPANPSQELLTERLVYGEQHPASELGNLRGKVYLHVDQSGVVASDEYDFKGNLQGKSQRLATEFKRARDWTAVDAVLPANAQAKFDPAALEAALAPRLESDTYASSTTYDALNRTVTLTTPHTPGMQPNVIRPAYNEASLLERLDANLRGATAGGQPVWTPFVTNIDYDAKAQRRRIDYATRDGRLVSTSYTYDRDTFRLIRLYSRRGVDPATRLGVTFTDDCDNPQPPPPTAAAPEAPPLNSPCGLQNLQYTYDPVGNITHVHDDAQQTVYFRNRRVEPSADYTYDAIYRLTQATGREHLGQVGGTPLPHSHDDAPRVGVEWSANDRNAMGTYTEDYLHDAVGNFLEMRHQGVDPAHAGWTRTYAYDEASFIEDGTSGLPLKTSNRLTSTTVGGNNAQPERYLYDAHGNTIRMPHLGGAHPAHNMHWDYRDQLRQTDMGGGGTAYYTYDAGGQRVRKVWEKSPALTEERLYLGGFEIFRRRQGAARLERETLHLMSDTERIALVEIRALDTAGTDPAPSQLIRYQLGNHLGSTSLELDDQAQIISHEEYTPYGSTSYQAVRSQTDTPKRYRYTGKERDEESGLYYHGARYYAPWLGRWTKPDPLFLKDATNVYLYALDNPIVATDPTGGPAWFIPVVIYLGYKALTSAAETGVEAGIAKATDDESFSYGGTFLKNMVVNSTIGLIPGTSEAKIGVKVAVYGAKLTLRTTADATLDTAMGKGDFSDNFVKSGLGNVGGDVVGAGAKKLVDKTGAGEKVKTLFDSKKKDASSPDVQTKKAGAPPTDSSTKKQIEADAAPNTKQSGSSDRTGARLTPVTVKESKWDYFFGRVTSNPHNKARSLQNVKDLETLGIKEAEGGRAKLLKLLEEGKDLPATDRITTEHGVTIIRTIKVGDKGAIDAAYFYPGGDLSATPEISSLIPKIFTK